MINIRRWIPAWDDVQHSRSVSIWKAFVDSDEAKGGESMNVVLGELFGATITGWKLIGYLGTFLFAGRWVVQILATRSHGHPVVPRAFWLMSVSGSLLLLAYFIWGKNDSVGVLSNLFPASVALYNLMLDLKTGHVNANTNAAHSRR